MSDDRYVVTYRTQPGRFAAFSLGGPAAFELPNRKAVVMHLSEAQVSTLRTHADVEAVELDARRYPMAETVPFGITMVGTAAVPEAPTVGDPKVKVCIIDSGIRAGHEDFVGLKITGKDDTGSGKWNNDTCGHGTHVAGTIAAVAGNGVGVVGVAPDAVELNIVKVFGGTACGWSYSSTLVAALDACRAAGAKVVSMSLGGTMRSSFEERAFSSADAAGVLSIAAAGNDGNTSKSYPASYSSVVSVAAIDQNKVVADFSQRNKEVDLSAPGVGIRSTYVVLSNLTVSGASYEGGQIEFAPYGSGTGNLVDGGLCDRQDTTWSRKTVLCQRGTIAFYDKVHNAQLSGAAAVAIYNNEPGAFSGTLGEGNTSTIPAISLSQEDGQTLLAHVGESATVSSNFGDGYAVMDGTSMATPHVSGVAALVWAQFPKATNKEIRNALLSTAEDLGPAGRDDSYGFGLVRADRAYDFLNMCSVAGTSCTSNAQCCTGTCSGSRNSKTCK